VFTLHPPCLSALPKAPLPEQGCSLQISPPAQAKGVGFKVLALSHGKLAKILRTMKIWFRNFNQMPRTIMGNLRFIPALIQIAYQRHTRAPRKLAIELLQ